MTNRTSPSTWVFNHTEGSLLLAILLHTSINTFSLYVAKLFPDQAQTQWNGLIGFGVTALLIVYFTRGRLGYGEIPGYSVFSTRRI